MQKFIASVMCTFLLFCGCTKKNENNSIKTGYVKEIAGEWQTVIDMGGNRVKVPVKVDKVVNLWASSNQMMLLLGAGDKIAGTHSAVKRLAWFNKVYPGINGIKTVSTGSNTYNIEELIALNPDLVITSDADEYKNISEKNIPVIYVKYDNYDDLKTVVLLIGEIFGTKYHNKAKEYVDYLNRNLALTATETSGIPQDRKIKVYHGFGQLLTTVGEGSIAHKWITAAGGVNTMAHEFEANHSAVTIETVIKADPDIITLGNANVINLLTELENDEKWSGITAVKNKKVYLNPVGVFYWDRYSTESALQILWAAKLYYPERFKDIDMLKETVWFYDIFYGYKLSATDAEDILSGKRNPSSN